MQNSFPHTTPATYDEDTTTPTQSESVDPERRKNLQDMKRRLRLQPMSSCKAILFSHSEEERKNNKATEVNGFGQKKKFQDLYVSLDNIGKGSCGVVKRIMRIEDKAVFAAKIMRAIDVEHIEQAKKEHYILSNLQHKNIIAAKEFFYDEVLGDAQLVLEYFPSKNLEQLIKEKGKIEEDKVKKIIEQVLSALKYLHDKGVCHRDITASNILVNENYQVKLIDFSISKINREELWSPTAKGTDLTRKNSALSSKFQNYMFSDAGTDFYKAPEMVAGMPYTEIVDMWSLGVVTFYALVGYRPFQSRNLDKLNMKITKVNYKWDPLAWTDISNEALLFVQACLKKVPFIRMSAKEGMYHPWIRGIKLDLGSGTKLEKKKSFHRLSSYPRREQEINTLFGKSIAMDTKKRDLSIF